MKRKSCNFFKRIIAVSLTVISITGLMSTVGYAQDDWSETVEITAHRGNKAEAPENTLPAFQSAIDSGADWIELDVTQTSDGVLVVFHDDDFKRIGDSTKKVSELSFKEIRQLDVGSYFGPRYYRTRIPSLEEVLDQCNGKIKVNIELKYKAEHSDDFLVKLNDLIQQRNMGEQCMITSFHYDYLQKIKELNPALVTGLITSQPNININDYPSADNFVLGIQLINADIVNQVHALSKKVIAWTVNDQYSVKVCRVAGVDNIITDCPRTLINPDGK